MFMTAKTVQSDANNEICRNHPEYKDQGDFVDYGWANIGSFDDLDRIFSNDDPLFGNESLINADELWSSSKNAVNSPVKSFPSSVDSPSLCVAGAKSTSENLEIKSEYAHDNDQSTNPVYGQMGSPNSHDLRSAHFRIGQADFSRSQRKQLLKERATLEVGKSMAWNSQHIGHVASPVELGDQRRLELDWSSNTKLNGRKRKEEMNIRKLLKSRKKPEEKSEGRHLRELSSTWSPHAKQFLQFDNQIACPAVRSYPSSVVSQPWQLQGPELLQSQIMSRSFVGPCVHGANQHSVMPPRPQMHLGEDVHQPVVPNYEALPVKANQLDKSPDAPSKPLIMTPQEKIEKLRRRQQLQALIAIQRQQQQFGQQVPGNDHSTIQNSPQENQGNHIDGKNIENEENLGTFPSFDPSSPLEQDDSNTLSMVIDEYSVEDTVLYQLQEIIGKMDMRIRLCIRDSLFRLAQSAAQRHYASDTSSTNKSSRDENKVAGKEEINSHNRISSTEAETNPIDRTVAHLLFHRPLELSGNHLEALESPVSVKLPAERGTANFISLTTGFLPGNTNEKHNWPQAGSNVPCATSEPHQANQIKSSPCMDLSENASNTEPPEQGAPDVEASQ
ncbi:hypothetical protein RJ641_036842 [Dillenia turbinata]|uniref:Protein LNK2 n=1 Tax=Dillenia turbinata TaxID=194707 RepID=A0AAN8ZHA7_9MAGN